MSPAQHILTNEFDNLFGSKICLVQWFSYFRVVAISTLHKLHQQRPTLCSDLQQHLHDHNGHLRVHVGMAVDDERSSACAPTNSLEIQCFVRNKVFVRQGFVQMKIVADGIFFDLCQVSDMQALYPPRNTVFICWDAAEL